MPEYTAEIDIDPSEFVSDCSSSEIKELIEALHEDGHLEDYFKEHKIEQPKENLMDLEWSEVIAKLSRNRLLMTAEEEETIKKIALRLL